MKTSLKDKIDELVDKYDTIKKASFHFFTKIIPDCPFERKDIKPGKLYVFKYFPEKKKNIYDSYPFIMALGPDKTKRNLFYGIDMHHMPYEMRLQIFEYIYDVFSYEIDKNIEKYNELKDSGKQDAIKEINTDLISKSPFNVDISPSIHRYDMKYVADCRLLNYSLLPYMLLSEDDYFVNGSIRQAQEEFIKKCNKN